MPYNEFVVTIARDTKKGFCIQEVKQTIWINAQNPEILAVPGPPLPFHADRFLQETPEITEAIGAAIQRQPPDIELLRGFGRHLFRETFKEPIQEQFRLALRVASGQQGLRVRLRLPPELQILPWELMCFTDQNGERFLFQGPATLLVRSGLRAGQDVVIPLQYPLRVLVIVATPFDQTPLNAREEINRLLLALTDLIRIGKVHVDFVHGADTLGKLLFATRNELYHIWHFIGHGEEEKGRTYLVLEDDNRRTRRISPRDLYAAFEALKRPRLAFLNVCQGAVSSEMSVSIADGFLGAGIPAVIAHQFEISDRAAEILAKHLYDGLAQGVAVDEALAFARQMVAFDDQVSIECHTPVLFLHNASGQLFVVPAGAPAPTPNFTLLVDRTEKAMEARRWSEAADYAQEALIVQPGHAEVLNLQDSALTEETLDRYLHEARDAEKEREWASAIRWYEKYEDNQAARQRSQTEQGQITRLRQAAQAGAGVRDPLLQWKG